MKNIHLVDVTLRDGGYRNNFNFTPEFAAHAAQNLAEAGIPFIEIGYCKGTFAKRQEHGLTSSVTSEYINALQQAVQGRSKLCVMVHPQNIEESDLVMLAEHGVAKIRVCIRPDQLENSMKTLATAKRLGFMVSSNITHVTKTPFADISAMALRSEDAGADLIVFADSNGNMIPTDVQRLIGKIGSRTRLPLGFHAHNNLTLALSNAIAAVDAGAEYIDASICGMGKGAGNLHLGMIVAYLDRLNMQSGYDLVKILELSSHASENVELSSLPLPLIDIMLGAYNISFDAKQKIAASLPNPTESAWFQKLRSLREEVGSHGVGLVNAPGAILGAA
ncbi:hypothetical protein [Chromobacterium sp. ASV23]|uniref:hypothetical protein n=1 Tax=Chromobacterium sp. ASV23 TaxID=2795110 RepID=UPI0018EA8E2E|nr:hypothetical protein [Chromobacterium sp. ASV23]